MTRNWLDGHREEGRGEREPENLRSDSGDGPEDAREGAT